MKWCLLFAAGLFLVMLQLMKAASFVMRYSKCKPDLCNVAQMMGLFGFTTKSPHLFARGATGWKLFTKSGGVTVFAEAMPGAGKLKSSQG